VIQKHCAKKSKVKDKVADWQQHPQSSWLAAQLKPKAILCSGSAAASAGRLHTARRKAGGLARSVTGQIHVPLKALLRRPMRLSLAPVSSKHLASRPRIDSLCRRRRSLLCFQSVFFACQSYGRNSQAIRSERRPATGQRWKLRRFLRPSIFLAPRAVGGLPARVGLQVECAGADVGISCGVVGRTGLLRLDKRVPNEP
jgi:hypothetical protein